MISAVWKASGVKTLPNADASLLKEFELNLVGRGGAWESALKGGVYLIGIDDCTFNHCNSLEQIKPINTDNEHTLIGLKHVCSLT